MNLKDIEKIVKLMDDHGLTQFKLEQDETKLELKKSGDVDVDAVKTLLASQPPMMAQPSPAMMAPQPGPASAQGPAQPAGDAGLPAGVEEIKSPMVGTFYSAPKPESPPFVSAGSKVDTDSPVCIIEAMKVMNEIQAEMKGEIVEVLVENGTPVQFGDPLFRIKTS